MSAPNCVNYCGNFIVVWPRAACCNTCCSALFPNIYESQPRLANSFVLRQHGSQIKIGKRYVKCTLVQALRLCIGRTAHRGSRGIALPYHDHGTGRGWGVSVTPRPLLTPGKDPVPIVQEAGWAPGPVWTGGKPLPTGIRFPDRPARSQLVIPTELPGPQIKIEVRV